MNRADEALLVFAKAPVAGEVKTRLIPTLGAQAAAQLQARLLHHALRVARAAHPGRLELWCAPDCAHPFLRQCAVRFAAELEVQVGSDVGERMAHALRRHLGERRSAVLIGSDCPSLEPDDVRAAFRALRSGRDAVFSPTEDGGYALIGLSRFEASLFEGVSWSTPHVMAQTRERMVRLRWRWQELAMRWDIDRPEDWARLKREAPPGASVTPS
jgi:rSAM/selenodomain-associated transferase 1